MNNMGDGGIGKAEEDSNGMTFFPILAHIDSPKKWTTNSFYYSENKIQKWMKYSLIRMDMPQWPLNVNEATIRALEEGKRGMDCFVIVGWNNIPRNIPFPPTIDFPKQWQTFEWRKTVQNQSPGGNDFEKFLVTKNQIQ